MSKIAIIIIIVSISYLMYSFYSKKGKPTSSIHQFKTKTIDGELFDFSLLKGKKILIIKTL